MPESCNLCKVHGVPWPCRSRELPAPRGPCRSGKFCSTAKIPPLGCLREKRAASLPLFYRRRNREDTGAASKFRADPPGFLSHRHFSWEHTIPHTLLMFSPQRTRILHLSSWETSFTEVACLLSLWTGRDWGYFELKKVLLFLCATPSSFPCRPVSPAPTPHTTTTTSLSLSFLLRLLSLECCIIQKFFLCLNSVLHLTNLFQPLTASH